MEINGLSATPELSDLLQCIVGDPLFILERLAKIKIINHFIILNPQFVVIELVMLLKSQKISL